MVLTISEVIELPVPVIIGLVVTYVVDKIPEVIEVVSDEDEFMSIMVLATVEVDICGEIDGVRLSVVVTLECDSVRGLSVVVTTLRLGTVVLTTLKVDMVPELDV